jgi:citronellyl-CoA dehydrogenase
VTKLASMAKLKCGRLAARSPTAACSTGAAWASPGRQPDLAAYRDSRLVSIGGGADEVMLGIICKLEGTLPGHRGERAFGELCVAYAAPAWPWWRCSKAR